jgi:hypothetical protein
MFGGSPKWIAIGFLIVIGLILTLAPVVYVALERIQMVKVAAVGVLIVVAAIFAIGANAWADLPDIVTQARIPAEELGFAVLLGALAFAGAGGARTSARATGSGTRVSAWASTCRASRVRSPEPEAAPTRQVPKLWGAE